ncbi:SDR family NAD(P)-dependent oxidoreductase [Pedobacter hartonius]|uniref:NADP-dependent 3-hydroxy acid dehydrogenase YdfG n=1 Tax=Pedobacter hartonius TaxID=425514 RepID=A0A1H4H1R2_9SPHI|nr:SDR family NAD(P)-dependent oxidoreductase [Pedobacter hartonius]SEB14942.1 NADP-dependent 3-hydroxy acid dehydrogenase YdfG [Pedobacter hartonius]
MDSKSKVWYVTGASNGLGLSLVKQLLAGGYRVAATSMNLADLECAVGEANSNFLPMVVDLTKEDSVSASLQTAVDTFGKIDVVVNNEDHGQIGSLEELSDKEARATFEINVFAMINVIRNSMPHFRKQQSGHIFNISSIGGFSGGYPGFSIYCATKFAVIGVSESLAMEAKPFGIDVTVVLPDYFRSNLLSYGPLSVAERQIPEYDIVRDVQQAYLQAKDSIQDAGPEKTAGVIIDVAESGDSPLHLFLGKEAYEIADQKVLEVKKDMCLWKSIAAHSDLAVNG